jgi:hypothetical protein
MEGSLLLRDRLKETLERDHFMVPLVCQAKEPIQIMFYLEPFLLRV